jgi:hypothetical protein
MVDREVKEVEFELDLLTELAVTSEMQERFEAYVHLFPFVRLAYPN